jgi:hypothetical protein
MPDNCLSGIDDFSYRSYHPLDPIRKNSFINPSDKKKAASSFKLNGYSEDLLKITGEINDQIFSFFG